MKAGTPRRRKAEGQEGLENGQAPWRETSARPSLSRRRAAPWPNDRQESIPLRGDVGHRSTRGFLRYYVGHETPQAADAGWPGRPRTRLSGRRPRKRGTACLRRHPTGLRAPRVSCLSLSAPRVPTSGSRGSQLPSGANDFGLRVGALDGGESSDLRPGGRFRSRLITHSKDFPLDGALTVGLGVCSTTGDTVSGRPAAQPRAAVRQQRLRHELRALPAARPDPGGSPMGTAPSISRSV